jgi:predicted RNA-binding Zn ribbon-like protein
VKGGLKAVETIDYMGDAEPAPGRLALVERFVNTVDHEHGREVLSDPGRLRDVLELDRAIRIGDDDLRRALELREALRSLALANNGGDPDPPSLAVLEQAAERGGLVVRFRNGAARLEPRRRDVDGALAELVGIVHTAMADGTWSRLKACRRDVCGWLFYDRSRNRSGVWCQMAVCGNRIKTKAYRERRETRPARTGRR